MSYKLCEPAVEIIMIVKNNCSISLTRLSACFLSTFFLIKKLQKIKASFLRRPKTGVAAEQKELAHQQG
ncbi:hypothetical protein GGR21_001864 [Dysgonomonas hofstadii]|uniref:Uncharacterized protein n=1 Tax=Dysgonomonas hofstadii TaxID=637886 RepID=A0A840CMQ5_9BACT|nr:hypothetical protein [Dysgonomonas hofstadii]